MPRIPAELGLTAEELDELMTTSWNMRIATIGPGERINVTPLWFGWAAGRVYFYCRGQKVANLRHSPVCTVLVDRNERFPELQGAMFQGHATVLENAEQEGADPHLEEVRWLMGTK
ncbi:MAG: pyridoxamine 5'-phosphate oxidase family protein, partial [Mycobacterium sp.]